MLVLDFHQTFFHCKHSYASRIIIIRDISWQHKSNINVNQAKGIVVSKYSLRNAKLYKIAVSTWAKYKHKFGKLWTQLDSKCMYEQHEYGHNSWIRYLHLIMPHYINSSKELKHLNNFHCSFRVCICRNKFEAYIPVYVLWM